jgi:sugar lactone lactonase YvrE
MPATNLDIVLDLKIELGEGPIWDVERQRLLFVNIMAGEVHAFDPSSGEDTIFQAGQPVSAVTPTIRHDWLLAVRDGFMRLDPETGATKMLASVETDRPDNRMNDGYCDARGRYWAGTLSMRRQPEASALYRLDTDGRVTTMLTQVTTSNGIDWSADSRRMYYADTPTSRIDVFDFDLDRGDIANRRPFVTFGPGEGRPDGLIVDADDCIWVALWGGSAVRRYDPSGRLDRAIDVPATQPTKCAFGGSDLTDLYITSAWERLSDDARKSQPHAGSLFHCRPGVKGRPAPLFGG